MNKKIIISLLAFLSLIGCKSEDKISNFLIQYETNIYAYINAKNKYLKSFKKVQYSKKELEKRLSNAIVLMEKGKFSKANIYLSSIEMYEKNLNKNGNMREKMRTLYTKHLNELKKLNSIWELKYLHKAKKEEKLKKIELDGVFEKHHYKKSSIPQID